MQNLSFKPYYNWNTFNTLETGNTLESLYLSFKPCYKWNTFNTKKLKSLAFSLGRFKPCYKWNTFNTKTLATLVTMTLLVLNLVISGIPSIL